MDTNTPTLKKASIASLLALLLLFVIALIYYKERVFFADAAFVVFNTINYHRLDIQFHRYGSFVTQMFPYFGGLLHFPLRAIYMAYSGSFSFFYFVVVFILYRCRQYQLAILMALACVLVVSDSFFWISEIPQGVGWMFLLFGVTVYMGNKHVKIWFIAPVFVLLTLITVFTHFVLLIPTAFLWIYLIINKKNWPFDTKNTIALCTLLASVILFKFLFTLSGPQVGGDGPHLYNVTHVSFKDIFESFGTPVVTTFGNRCLTNYWICILLLIPGFYSLAKSKKWLQISFVVLSLLGYIIIMGLAYGDLDTKTLLFHIESEWMCIGILAATPFVLNSLPGLKVNAATIIFAGIFATRIIYICSAIPMFQKRVHFQEKVIAQMKKKGITKLALYKESGISDYYLLEWGAGYESVLASAADGENPVRTFAFIDGDNNKPALDAMADPSKVYLWGPTTVRSFDNYYFKMDSTHPYEVMFLADLMK